MNERTKKIITAIVVIVIFVVCIGLIMSDREISDQRVFLLRS